MLKKGCFMPTRMGVLTPILLLMLILSAGLSQPAQATSVRIQNIEDVPLGQNVQITIDFEDVDPGQLLVGFDLLLAYDYSGLSLLDIAQGQMLTDCEWEYFSFRAGPDANCGDSTCPDGVVRIVAMADIANGPIHPSCYAENPGQLAVLTFRTTNNPTYACYYLPIRFYWTDCGDNSFSNLAGDSLLISDRVIDVTEMDITEESDFPTFFGAPSECLSAPTVIRGIDYYNGGTWLTCDPELAENAVVMIQGVSGVWLGEDFSVGINLQQQAPDAIWSSYDFLIHYDETAMTFIDAQPGQMLDDCGWEYFVYRAGPEGDCGGVPCPDGTVRVVAVADLNNGEIHPSCLIDSTGELATLGFQLVNDSALMDQTFPIEWWWHDCGDNATASQNGDTLFVSNDVYDYFGFPITQDASFPTFFGAPSECLAGAERGIDFYNGRVRVAGGHFISGRGDVNYNGIANEIADLVLFSNYFYYGTEVFTVDSAFQIATTDINADGLMLTLQDFMYLYRIIIGTATPIEKSAFGVDTVEILHDLGLKQVSFNAPDSLAAIRLTFDGEIIPEALFETTGFQWWYKHESGQTEVMVMPELAEAGSEPNMYSGVLFSYTGYGLLTEVEAADYADTWFYTSISYSSDQEKQATISIEKTHLSMLGTTEEIAITLDSVEAGFEMAGFDLMIGYDALTMTLMGITQGQLLTDCDWEYFTYRQGAASNCDIPGCPSGVVRIVAMADVNNGENHPTCYGDTGGELARLTMVITSDPAYEYMFLPINWFWNDCGDNAVSSRYGDSMFVSSDVYDAAGTVITQEDVFPTMSGLPSTCLTGPNIVRTLDFHNGGIDLLENMGCNSGDINVNGVYYEVSDFILFTNYFTWGLSVFIVAPEWQIAQTDINCDGIPLSVADLVFLLRIIIGDTQSGPSPPTMAGDTCIMVQDTLAGTISLSYTQTLSTVHLLFDGEIVPEFDFPQHETSAYWDGVYTRVLIIPQLELGTLSPINSGPLFSYSGSGNLILANVAFDGQRTIPVYVEGSGATACCAQRGNVDGDTSSSSLVNITDITKLVSYLFSEGLSSPCSEEANVDGLIIGGSPTNISDLTYLVAYIFTGGPPPPPCP
ncbi:MAG: hypothetical protein KOO62_10455 [candidate division Zixibacteria bacterium]|nr:hypothetical protein [candidate division Zixibacteria bacterium]